MAIVIFCPGCKVRLTLGDDHAGGSLPCPRCDLLISVPVVLPAANSHSPPPLPLPPAKPMPLPAPTVLDWSTATDGEPDRPHSDDEEEERPRRRRRRRDDYDDEDDWEPPRRRGGDRKSRLIYIILALFLGEFGIHNFYAERTGIAVTQLLLCILSVVLVCVHIGWLGLIGLFIWSLIEIVTVEHDGRGRRMTS